MQREEFKKWLITEKKYDLTTINSRISNCSTIEQAYGDLDEHFTNDRFTQIMSSLKYSRQDERDGILPTPPLVIDGVVYDGLATLRQGLNRYSEFKIYQELNEDNVEYLSNDFSKIKDSGLVIEKPINFENKNTLLLLPIYNLRNKIFIIESYQRGYKWGKKEILELLNDIEDYKPGKGIYCLQPIILKPIGLDKITHQIDDYGVSVFKENEILDGQQRTTSIYLILHFLKQYELISEEITFSISYKIRERSGLFLKEDVTRMFEFLPITTEENLYQKDYKNLNNLHFYWAKFIAENEELDNVDIYHFFSVGFYIKLWFEAQIGSDKQKQELFCKKFLHHIHVIWYSLDDSISNTGVIDVFLNNNKGKIQLTPSELIKALFILEISNKEGKAVAEYKVNRFALEWDQIEKKLQDNSFWYFIQPDSEKYKKGTRIDFLFDVNLSIRKKEKKSDDYFAYREYEKLFHNENSTSEGRLANEWGEFVELFNKFVDWYQDSYFYHYIGYLTTTKILNLREILLLSKGKTKDVFKNKLKDKIIEHFLVAKDVENKKVFPFHIDSLHYKDYYEQTMKVLLLHNVLYYVDKMSQNKFPFELYIEEKWSIEHIVPQNPKDFESSNDYVQYKMWFKDQIKFQQENFDNNPEELVNLINKLENISGFEGLKKEKELKIEIDNLISNLENKTDLVSNLVLLDRNTNSSLGNLFFEKKREKILKFDKLGKTAENKEVFIPVETLKAFNKTFSSDIEFKHWSNKDGLAYKNSISERLKGFLPENV